MFLLLLIAAAIVAAVLPQKYRSQALLLVRLGRENATLDAVSTLGKTRPPRIPPKP